ncbi:MAG: hypothetical protein U9N10_02660 [Bacillota bacterium]|nr:hypothetical protein [Bacillota bacterium]
MDNVGNKYISIKFSGKEKYDILLESYKVLSKKLVIEMDFDKEYKRIKDEYNNWMQLTILELQLKKRCAYF